MRLVTHYLLRFLWLVILYNDIVYHETKHLEYFFVLRRNTLGILLFMQICYAALRNNDDKMYLWQYA